MTTPAIDALAHRAARFSRRRSLLTLGGAALAAVTAAAMEPASARKKNNKKKNNRGNRNGAVCRKREQQRCTADAAACRATILTLCPDVNDPACLAAQTCCDDCSASTLLACITALNQS